MYIDKDKTQLDTRPDLTLYIENLFQRDEEEIDNEVIAEATETVHVPDIETGADIKTEEDGISTFSDIPLWGQQPFECLLVKAAGMDYMLPALSVSFIERLNKEIVRIPLEVKSFQGVISLRGKSLAVIDLYSLITEDKVDNDKLSSQITLPHIDHIMVMENNAYALACDKICKMITLKPEDIRWSSSSLDDPFYAGMTKEYLCPLINTDSLYQRISTMPFVKSLRENND